MNKDSPTALDACQTEASQELLRGVMQFNRGEYYPCHETLEELWLAEKGPIRCLYQGILQLAVALHHWQRRNYRGAVALLESGGNKLATLPARCRQIDIAALRKSAAVVHTDLLRLGPQGMGELDSSRLPRIILLPSPGSSPI